MKAKVGFLLSPSFLKTSWPNFPIVSAWDLLVRNERPERSAPAANINGLPVIAIATESDDCAASIAARSDSRPAAPKVFGRLWSIPLSKVINERVPDVPNGARETSRRIAFVTTSSGAPSGNLTSLIYLAPLKFGFSQIIVPPIPSPIHIVVMP